MLLVWKDTFAIDNGAIDHDHQVLVVHINDVLRRLSTNPRADTVLKDLVSLRMNAEHHFKREELLQELVGYPALEQHTAEHRQLLAAIDVVLAEIEGLPPESPIADAKKKKALLYHWVIRHFLDSDQEIKPFAARLAGSRQRSAEPTAPARPT